MKFFFRNTLPFLILIVIFFSAFTGKVTTQVSFSVNASVSNNVNSGTFTSSGLVGSSGNYVETYSFNGKKTHSEATFTFFNGTITAKTHSEITISASTASGTGTWIIVRGTGAYTGIQGSGKLTLSVSNIGTSSESISQSWSGSIK